VRPSISEGKAAAKAARVRSFGFTFDDWPAIRAGLATVAPSAIRAATGLSIASVTRMRTGSAIPEARHWSALASLAGFKPDA
jgi:hypothetical protein